MIVFVQSKVFEYRKVHFFDFLTIFNSLEIVFYIQAVSMELEILSHNFDFFFIKSPGQFVEVYRGNTQQQRCDY